MMPSKKIGCTLSFPCAFCGQRLKLSCVQGQHVEDLDRHSALGMRSHVCRRKRWSSYELRTGWDVLQNVRRKKGNQHTDEQDDCTASADSGGDLDANG